MKKTLQSRGKLSFLMKNEFESVFERIKGATGLKNLKSLAETLEISQPAISEMKGKGKFPPGWAYIVGKKFDLSTEWVMTGEGPKTLNEQRGKLSIEELEQWARENQMEGLVSQFKEWRKNRGGA